MKPPIQTPGSRLGARVLSALVALALVLGLSAAWPSGAFADKARVLKARVTDDGDGTYTFTVTVEHADTGWKHYADKFEILTLDGKVIATRTLLHPHVDEQPFTRSLFGVRVPPGTDRVVVRASDNVHGVGNRTVSLRLPTRH